MSGSLILACLWIVAASGLAIGLRRLQGGVIYLLIVLGIPVAGWVTLQHGPLLGMVSVGIGAVLLRWPLVRLYQRARGRP